MREKAVHPYSKGKIHIDDILGEPTTEKLLALPLENVRKVSHKTQGTILYSDPEKKGNQFNHVSHRG